MSEQTTEMTQLGRLGIGGGDPIPQDQEVRRLRQALDRPRRHYAIERGGRRAHSEMWCLIRRIRRLAHVAARAGVTTLELHSSGQTTAPPPYDTFDGLGFEIRGCVGDRIVWDIALWSSGGWARTGRLAHRHPWTRADAVLRAIVRDEAGRRAEVRKHAEAAAAAYTASLPPSARSLQETCRATCLRVAPDALSVTEILHDCGGSATYTQGSNGYHMPASLAEMQAEHDRIYHIAAGGN